jgi:hypothetical protein
MTRYQVTIRYGERFQRYHTLSVEAADVAEAMRSAAHGVPPEILPLAGSHWMTGDPETPIRIVLLGLSGEIDVNGSKFNLVMPPPEGLTDDAEIAEAISYARTSFGNQASPVDVDLVKKVRASLGERTAPWTAAELSALRSGTPPSTE